MSERNILFTKGVISGTTLSIIITVFSLAPNKWMESLGAWGSFLSNYGITVGSLLFATTISLAWGKKLKQKEVELQEYRDELDKTRSNRKRVMITQVDSAVSQILTRFETDVKHRTIKILAATGATIFPQIRQYLMTHAGLIDLELKILLIDSRDDSFDKAAMHWRNESGIYQERLEKLGKEYSNRRITISTSTYRLIPPIHGMLFGDEHLFFGFYQWYRSEHGDELLGAEYPYLFFQKDDKESEPFFSVFNTWFDYLWRQGTEPPIDPKANDSQDQKNN